MDEWPNADSAECRKAGRPMDGPDANAETGLFGRSRQLRSGAPTELSTAKFVRPDV